MGFDNECILNIQSLPGEYFCPVCRTLIYPNEALQSQCTHLYCKPCLAYTVATTPACPYDGYLVTEADSKPLMESNKALAETIGKVAVHCLYHRSGCQWQGTLSECITHCTGCTFGNSPVVCNRCGTQIIHRQVQEHTQICPGLQPQAQQVESGQTQASTTSNQAVSQEPSLPSSAAPASTTSIATVTTSTANLTTAASATPTVAVSASSAVTVPATSTTPAPVSAQSQNQANMTAYAQPATQGPTPQQWYQQQQLQYQQYYQMYPGYDPYQQQYQQYAQYQQQAYPQYAQPQMQVQGQQQSSVFGQPQSQPLPQPQVHAQQQPQPQLQAVQIQQQQPLTQTQPQSLPQPQSQPNTQLGQLQTQQPNALGQQPYPQTNQLPPAQIAGQQFGQPPQPHYPQMQPQQQMQAPPYQQTMQPQPLPPSLPQQQPHTHAQPQARPTALQQPPTQPQPHPQYPSALPQAQAQPIGQPQHASAHAVTGHQSFQQPQMIQQTQPGAPSQRPMFMHPQQQVAPQQHPVQLPNQYAPQQPSRMPAPSGSVSMQVQQQQMLLPQRPAASNQQQPHSVQHGQQLHQYPGMHAQAPQQGLPQQSLGHVHPGHQFPQGMAASQQQMHHQGPHIQHPAQPHQQNVPAHHQGQAVATRPMMGNNGMPHQPIQQFPGSAGKPAQPGYNQQSPSQSHLAWPGSNLPLTTNELQKSHPQSGSQGISGALSSAPHSGVVDKVGHTPELSSEICAKNAEGSTQIDTPTTELKIGGESKEKDVHLEVDSKNTPGRSLDSSAAAENVEPTGSKPTVNEELAELSEDGAKKSHVLKDGYAGGSQSAEAKPEEKTRVLAEALGGNLSDAKLQGHSISTAEPAESHGLSEGQVAGEAVIKTQAPQQLPAPSNERGHLQQPTHHSAPSFEGASFQSSYQDRNLPQSAWQGPGTGTPQAVPSAGLLPGKEGYPPQQVPYGHPPNAPITPPRFAAPDRTLPHHMPHSGAMHDRRPQEAPPYQMQVPAPNIASGQTRPPMGQNFPEHLPHQGQPSMVQDPLRPPSGQAYSGPPGTGLPSSGRAPGGFPQQGFPEQGMVPQGQGQSHFSQQHAGARVSHGEGLMRPHFVSHSGTLNTPNQMMPRGPPFHPEDRGGPSHLGPLNPSESEMYDTRRPGFSDVRQPDPLGQLNVIKANGIPGKMQIDGMHDPAFAHGLPEDRFKPLPDERFRPLSEDGTARTFPLDPGRHNVGRREFEEDLKQFPRPAHLDAEGVRNFDNYGSSLRPLDRGWQHVGPDPLTRPFDRALPRPDGVPSAFPANQAGSFPINRPGSELHMPDMLEPRRPTALREDFGRHMDVLPPGRSPLRDFGRFGPGGKPRMEDIDPRELHGFGSGPLPGRSLRGIPDGPRSYRMMEQFDPGNFPGIRKDLDGPGIPHMHLHSGVPFNMGHIPAGEPGFGANFGRDFLNEAGPFSTHNVRGDMEVFELLKKRKPGTAGWCRICSIDCETVEGLDMHAQTREHQKKAMDMVLSIKKDISKKQRISEDSNKTRKDFGKPLK